MVNSCCCINNAKPTLGLLDFMISVFVLFFFPVLCIYCIRYLTAHINTFSRDGTHRVFRPPRPRNMRPWIPVSLFPVKSSSRTSPAPSKAPSRMSFSLLLLRLLRNKIKIVIKTHSYMESLHRRYKNPIFPVKLR